MSRFVICLLAVSLLLLETASAADAAGAAAGHCRAVNPNHRPASRAAADDPTTTLTEAKFRQLLAELKPQADEAWRTIPWQTVLLDAQQQAAEEQKPIFIWAMDGHPLGCT